MADDEYKNYILGKIGKTLRELESSHGEGDYEVQVSFGTEIWEWNLTGWDQIAT